MNKSIIERILECVHLPNGECWIWVGAESGNGYGRISIGGRTRATHIVVYEALVGPVPEDKVLDHDCRNRLCCNPWHLTPRTALENTLLGEGPTAINARKTECIRGHKFTVANTIVRVRDGRPRRECRECRRMRSTRSRRDGPS